MSIQDIVGYVEISASLSRMSRPLGVAEDADNGRDMTHIQKQTVMANQFNTGTL
jgi:hypothetical protein